MCQALYSKHFILLLDLTTSPTDRYYCCYFQILRWIQRGSDTSPRTHSWLSGRDGSKDSYHLPASPGPLVCHADDHWEIGCCQTELGGKPELPSSNWRRKQPKETWYSQWEKKDLFSGPLASEVPTLIFTAHSAVAQLSAGRCYTDRDSDSSWVDMENHSGIILHRPPASSLTLLGPLIILNSTCTLTAVSFYFHWIWITFQFRIKEQWVGGSTVLRLKAWALGKKKKTTDLGWGPWSIPFTLATLSESLFYS